jgi:N-acetyl-gamma-glutamyl-phosphate reductase
LASKNRVRACVVGATGYTGIELVGLLSSHQNVELVFATSETYAGQSLSDVAAGAPDISLIASETASYREVDVAFLCLPHAAAAPTAVHALESGCRVIDLSADFRLRDPYQYACWYGVEHPAPNRLAEAVYGLTEDVRRRLPETNLVANPGCYATSVLLAMRPLLQADIGIAGPIVADAKSGVSGAGRAPKVGSLFAEVAENFSPYNVGRKHRHLPEMEQQMASWRSPAPRLIFSPHLLPVKRGILSTLYVPLEQAPPMDELHTRFRESYEGEPFVRVLPLGKLPSLAHVVGSNRCVIGLEQADSTLIVVSALDNLLKGAAGQAVQNMNAMYGWPETTGLPA